MNSLTYIFQLIGWVLLQGIVLNNINLFGYADPALYLLFFMTYPSMENKTPLFLLAALSGLVIDIFSQTGGIYTCALFFGQNFDEQPIKLLQVSFTLRLLYILSFTFIFHIIFSILETFQWELWIFTLHKTLITILLSTIVCLLVEQLIGNRKEEKY